MMGHLTVAMALFIGGNFAVLGYNPLRFLEVNKQQREVEANCIKQEALHNETQYRRLGLLTDDSSTTKEQKATQEATIKR